MSGELEHRPVMLEVVVDAFRTVPPGLVVDATVGGGGHASALLRALPGIRLLGLDRDEEALAAAAGALAGQADRCVLRRATFDELQAVVGEVGNEPVVGALFDLGISSAQVDRAQRGFSYMADGPLDMRMDRRQSLTAADVVNSYPEEELARVLAVYGDERHARRIAARVVAARPVRTTAELVEVIRQALPAPARRRRGHPAKRSFQALRIEVNGELTALPSALDQAIDVLVPRGRCVVLAYHSGEDRIVKRRFAAASAGGCTCPPGLPCVCGARPVVRPLWRGARRPSAQERDTNPRAGSARLRAVEKLAQDEPSGDDAA
jgi:16S rRNA (cytosine1402-N4)-methyltransferase